MSNNFNHIEYWAASFLSRFPGIKKHAKRSYQRFNFQLHKKNYAFQTDWKIEHIGDPNAETFFGYYDKFPEQNNWVLFHQFRGKTNTIPGKEFSVILNGYHIPTGEIREFDNSFAYNWQQGSRLHWLDTNIVIFNTVDKNYKQYTSKIYSIDLDKIIAQIDFPIYDTHKNFALSLNFKRLAQLSPDYGYNILPTKKSDIENLNDDGIYYVDLKKNKNDLLISFADVIHSVENQIKKDARHTFNHIMISPDGEKFMFIHRWYQKGGKYDSLMVANTDGSDIKCVANNGMVSHCFWKDNNTIFGYLRDDQFGNNYYSIDLISGNKKPVGIGNIDGFGDGHPFISSDLILFDTYPNKARMQELYLYNLENGDLEKVGEFFTPLKFYESFRCDLHPRMSEDGNSIYIDSTHEGTRKLYRLTRNIV